MNQAAIQFDKAELERHQPAQVPWVDSAQQGLNSLFSVIEAQGIGLTRTPKARFSQQLLLPPAVDAVGPEIAPLGLLQTLQRASQLRSGLITSPSTNRVFTPRVACRSRWICS